MPKRGERKHKMGYAKGKVNIGNQGRKEKQGRNKTRIQEGKEIFREEEESTEGQKER